MRRIIRLKIRWFRRAKRSKHPQDWLRYKALKKQAQKTCQDTHDSYTNDMLTIDNKNPKRFWNFIKSHKKDSTGVAPLKKEELTFFDSVNKANIMGVQFSSVFTQEDVLELPDLGQSQTPSAPPIKVNTKKVLKLLKVIKPHKATGPDNIPGRLLKEATEELAPGLAHLFQISIHNGTIPLDWKSALVTPVFKKGDQSSPSNYRPISLTSIVCKTLEHVIHSSVTFHFESNNILTDC